MRSTVHTMRYIKHKLPSFPVPAVLSFDTIFDNEIKTPFTILSLIDGVPASELWTTEAWTERQRIAFLQLLAKTMAELRTIEFDAIGMLYLENDNVEKPRIGPNCVSPHSRLSKDPNQWHREFKSARDCYMHAINPIRHEPNRRPCPFQQAHSGVGLYSQNYILVSALLLL